jgi:hemoglobin
MLNPDRPLYYRLGGYDAIAAFCDELLSRLTKDPTLAVYWKGKCDDSMRKERQLLVDFLCMIAGGPVNYSGRDMKTSHTGLGINEAEWNIFVEHAIAALSDLGVPEQEKEEVLSLAAGFKSDVVEMATDRKATH